MPIENDSSLSHMQDSSKPTSNQEESSGNVATENSKATKGRWTNEEHDRFIDALRAYGKDWYRVEAHIGGTRSSAQIRSHAQKFISKLEKEPDSQYDDI